MKVAILTPFFASAILERDKTKQLGIRPGHPYTWITNLARGLARQGVEVQVVTMSRDFGRDFVICQDDVTYNFFVPASKFVRGLTFFDSDRWKLQKFLRQKGFDIIHGQGMNAYSHYALTSGLSHVITIHLWVSGLQEVLEHYVGFHSRLLALRSIRGILKNGNNFISISPIIRRKLFSLGRKLRVFDIENAVDPRFFEISTASEEDFALYVGSIDPRKCVLEMLEALQSVEQLRLKIVSTTRSGEYYEAVQRFINRYGLSSRVEFLGPKQNEELVEIVKRCMFLVLFSRKEMSPMVISEAMAAGKPVIASAVDGIPFMVENRRTGFLVECGEIDQLAQQMRILMKNRDLRKVIGEEARQVACSRWHPEKVASETVAAYREILVDFTGKAI